MELSYRKCAQLIDKAWLSSVGNCLLSLLPLASALADKREVGSNILPPTIAGSHSEYHLVSFFEILNFFLV